MMPKQHILFGIGITIILIILGIPIIPILLIVTTSILIDIDHLLYYIFKFRRYNIQEMYIYFLKKICSRGDSLLPVLIFHNFETLILLIILSLIYPLFIYVAIGLFIHLILDWIAIADSEHPAIVKLSLILVLIENRKRERGNHKW